MKPILSILSMYDITFTIQGSYYHDYTKIIFQFIRMINYKNIKQSYSIAGNLLSNSTIYQYNFIIFIISSQQDIEQFIQLQPNSISTVIIVTNSQLLHRYK